MASDAFARFAVQFVINGYTMIDGVLSATAIDCVVNDYLKDMECPAMHLQALQRAKKGYHICYDIVANGRIIGLEITCLAELPPQAPPKQIGHQPAT